MSRRSSGFRFFFALILFYLGWQWVINLGLIGPVGDRMEQNRSISRDRWDLEALSGSFSTASKPVVHSDNEPNEELGKGSNGTAKGQPMKFHYVFSTGCSAFQDWQSYTFFFHANIGLSDVDVTRVASGCDDKAAKELQKMHREQIATLSGNFHLHLTPDYSKIIPGKNYKFFNKPLGLRNWMEESLGFPDTQDYENTIFIIFDPDQVILRPFEIDMSDHASVMKWKKEPSQPVRIQRGQPFAQLYGFSSGWSSKINENLSHVLDTLDADEAANSHLHHWTGKEVAQHYAAGPPYIATGRDMYNIVSTWAKFVRPVYDLTQDHLSEMFAYSTAAAHLNLPHHLSHSFMISNVGVPGEGWSWADETSGEKVCRSREDYISVATGQSQRHYLPNVLHYCQRYFLGPYFFSKYILPKNFLTCEHPLLVEPELDIADKYSTSVTPNGELNHILPQHRKRHAFMLCLMISRLNQAGMFWTQHHCDPSTANTTKSFLFSKKKKN